MFTVTQKSYCETLANYNAVGQAFEVLAAIEDHAEAYDYIENYISDVLATEYDGDNCIDDEALNDFLAYQALDVLEDAGYFNSDTNKWSDEDEDE